ncbi:hypothetical protein [Subtercola boreus]|uniref:hypothetical protein n=1 Tax=Subtercola boreus TaxID=120213 RepID=UPI001166D18D|nr:hypothetical protein [Subtercola boreus]TQL55326.1 hypothetical protein FB464_2889 [Subtercola boreus]
MKKANALRRAVAVASATVALTALMSVSGAGAASAFSCGQHVGQSPLCIPQKR